MGCCQVKEPTDPEDRFRLFVSNSDPTKPLLNEDNETSPNTFVERRPPVDLSRRRVASLSGSSDTIVRPVPIVSTPAVLSSSFDGAKGTVHRSASLTQVPTLLSKPLPLQDQVVAKLSRGLTDLPVPMDLPRMSGKITIVVNGQIAHSPADFPAVPSSVPASNQKIKIVLCALAGALELPELKQSIEDKFDVYIPQDYEGDIARKLKPFLDEVVRDGNVLALVLKCINQAIIAPAVLRMKSHLLNKITYKDCRNQWDVNVLITKEDDRKSIIVEHRKREQSVPEGFEFIWSLKFILSEDLTTTKDTTLTIPVLEWTLLKDEAEQARVEDLLSDLGYDRSARTTTSNSFFVETM